MTSIRFFCFPSGLKIYLRCEEVSYLILSHCFLVLFYFQCYNILLPVWIRLISSMTNISQPTIKFLLLLLYLNITIVMKGLRAGLCRPLCIDFKLLFVLHCFLFLIHFFCVLISWRLIIQYFVFYVVKKLKFQSVNVQQVKIYEK